MTSLQERREAVSRGARFILSRFETCRQVYSKARHLQHLAGLSTSMVAGPPVVENLDPVSAAALVHRDSYAMGLRLPEDLTKTIRDWAATTECGRGRPLEPNFRYCDVVDGRTPDGRAVVLAHTRQADACPGIRQIVCDPNIQETVSLCLGYRVRKIVPMCWWSIAGNYDLETRRDLYQTVDYHYDVHSLAFMYVSIYLTDVDATSGAHVLIRGSHRAKPLQLLWGSVRRSEDELFREYSRADEMVLEGPAGTGFVHDAACFHRAMAPTRRDRLLLQLRCS